MQIRIGRNWFDSKDVPMQLVLTSEEVKRVVEASSNDGNLLFTFNESLPVDRDQQSLNIAV